jgi:hypothetical protein
MLTVPTRRFSIWGAIPDFILATGGEFFNKKKGMEMVKIVEKDAKELLFEAIIDRVAQVF